MKPLPFSIVFSDLDGTLLDHHTYSFQEATEALDALRKRAIPLILCTSKTRSELLDRLAVLLGGRVAEEIVFGDISTGAQNDLQKATDIARSMITEYGMSEKMGLTTYHKERRSTFLEAVYSIPQEYGEEKAREIDEEVDRIMKESHDRVNGILNKKREALDRLAKMLLEKEIIVGDELRGLLSEMGLTKKTS